MGWTGDDTIFASMTPRKQIAMESIFVLADTNGGNADLLNILHNKAPHRKKIISQVIKYLS